MADVVAGRRVDRGGPGPRREVRPIREAGDVTDLDQEPGCAGGADAVQVEQPGVGGLDQGDEFLIGLLLALVGRWPSGATPG